MARRASGDSHARGSSAWTALRRFVLAALLSGSVAGCVMPPLRDLAPAPERVERHARVPPALERSLALTPDCCEGGEAVPARPARLGEQQTVDIGPGSPVMRLPGGRSFVSAWRIDRLPRPFLVEVTSVRSADPTAAGSPPGPTASRDLVLAPVVLVLDRHGAVRRVEQAGSALAECATDPRAPAFRIELAVVEPSDDASMLVVATTDSLRRLHGGVVCGAVRHGMAPAGRATIRFRALDASDDRGVPTVYPARLVTQSSGLARLSLPLRPGDAEGWLLLGERWITLLQPDADRSRAVLRLPLERLVSARELPAEDAAGPGVRVLAAPAGADDPGARLSDGLLALRIHVPGHASEVATRLSLATERDRWRETLGLVIDPRVPEIDFRPEGQPPLARIGESAYAGATTTAFPCTLCRFRACSPETLASCATLFTIGAVLGGAIGAGQELAQRITPEGKDVTESLARLETAVSPVIRRTQGEAFHQAAFAQCVREAVSAVPQRDWQSQGRTAYPQVEGLASTPRGPVGRPLQLDSRPTGGLPASTVGRAWVDRVSLLALRDEGSGLGGGSLPVRLQVVVGLEVRRDEEGLMPARMEWTGESYPRARWEQEGAELAATGLREACTVLGRAVVDRARRAWLDR